MKKYPGRTKPIIKSGLLGPKYYIEFPIAGRKIDALGLMLSTEKLNQNSRDEKRGAKIINTDSF